MSVLLERHTTLSTTAIEKLHRRATFFCDFTERHLPAEFGHGKMRKALERGFREKNVRGYRMAVRDIDAMVHSWDDVMRNELNRQWRAGPGAGQPSFGGAARELRGILRREKIRDAEEYRIVHDYLSDYDCAAEEREALSRMLGAYGE